MNEGRWRGWVVAAAIFVLGAGAGAAGVAWVGVRVLRQAAQNPGMNRGIAERAANRLAADLTKDLNLTPEESAEVQKALEQSAANLRAIRQNAATQATTELRGSIQRIARSLPREKRVEFYRVVVKRYKRLGLSAPVEENTGAPDAK